MVVIYCNLNDEAAMATHVGVDCCVHNCTHRIGAIAVS